MQLESAYTDGCLCIRYTGDLDHHAARAAFRETEAFIDRFLPRRCILDFSGVSSGIERFVAIKFTEGKAAR